MHIQPRVGNTSVGELCNKPKWQKKNQVADCFVDVEEKS